MLKSELVTPEHRAQFERDGYFLLEAVIAPAQLEMLRDECARFIKIMDAAMEAKGVETLGISHKNNRYFISNQYKSSDKLAQFLFSDLMAEVCRATLGPDAFLFHEQYVVKAAEKGMKFSWHQDSGYVGTPHPPYLTCWCPLDDVSEENGTVYLLPYERAGTRDWVPHAREAETNDMIGYAGDDPGIPVICPAGSIAAFSSTVFHRSGPNTTDKMRRVYLPQYSAAPLLRANGAPMAFADPFLKDGAIVNEPQA